MGEVLSREGTLDHKLRLCGTTVCYPTVQGHRFGVDRALEGIRSAGLKFVELVSVPDYCEHFMPEVMDAAAGAALRRQVEAFGLMPAVANIAADLTTDVGVDRLVKCIELAPAIGISLIVTHVEQTETAEGANAFFRRIGKVAEAAATHSIRIALETHGGLCTTGRQSIELVKQLGSPQIGVAYDTANVIYWGGVRPEEDLASIADEIADRVFHFHLKDKANMTMREYIFPVFGEGIVDFHRLLSVIAKSGYSGFLTLEVELNGYPESPELVDQAIRSSRQFVEAIHS
ncbi:MAG: sugar phosphate isomerase/epimerase family protein [Candidatus Dormibacteraceae bacterium]